MDVSSRFAQNLVAQRGKAGLSQEELASRADLHRTEISLIETGKRQPRLETLAKLAAGLGIAPAILVEGIAWNPTPPSSSGLKVSRGEGRS
jgi:transcriptional regulator with XRE-family HTH domain